HREWAIDPEPLIVFTASLSEHDPRLVDEAIDWCPRNWSFVSKTRLRNLLRIEPKQVQDDFGVFAATVGEHADISWPGSTRSRPFAPTGRSSAPQLGRPSMVWLRLRATFGLGARAEVLRYFLMREEVSSSVVTIARFANYSKRNVATECEALAHAGVLRVRKAGNRHEYSLVRRQAVEELLGGVPTVRPNWSALFHVARALMDLEAQVSKSTDRTLAVKTRVAFDSIGPALDDLDLGRLPPTVVGSNLWRTAEAIAGATLGRWASGHQPDSLASTSAF
ncbi:MAG: hypothetical protein KDB24_17665, partial [Microthrixaceae bacterium]|nr:hypothetical protein [Microthrixaceae bacterium]